MLAAEEARRHGFSMLDYFDLDEDTWKPRKKGKVMSNQDLERIAWMIVLCEFLKAISTSEHKALLLPTFVKVRTGCHGLSIFDYFDLDENTWNLRRNDDVMPNPDLERKATRILLYDFLDEISTSGHEALLLQAFANVRTELTRIVDGVSIETDTSILAAPRALEILAHLQERVDSSSETPPVDD